MRFRLLHPTSHVLIELLETPIQAAGIEVGLDGVTVMRRTDVADARVRGLMPGDAPVVDPATAFLNYADASRPSSGWHDANDGGTKARDRADALLALYPTDIADALATQASKGALPAHVQQFLLDAFGLELSRDGLSRD